MAFASLTHAATKPAEPMMQSHLSDPGDAPLTYDDETLWNYEVGLRSEWFEAAVISQLTAFYLCIAKTHSERDSSWRRRHASRYLHRQRRTQAQHYGRRSRSHMVSSARNWTANAGRWRATETNRDSYNDPEGHVSSRRPRERTSLHLQRQPRLPRRQRLLRQRRGPKAATNTTNPTVTPKSVASVSGVAIVTCEWLNRLPSIKNWTLHTSGLRTSSTKNTRSASSTLETATTLAHQTHGMAKADTALTKTLPIHSSSVSPRTTAGKSCS